MSLPAAVARPGDVVLVEPHVGEGRRPFVVASVEHSTPTPGHLTLVDPADRRVVIGGAAELTFISLAPRPRATTATSRSTS